MGRSDPPSRIEMTADAEHEFDRESVWCPPPSLRRERPRGQTPFIPTPQNEDRERTRGPLPVTGSPNGSPRYPRQRRRRATSSPAASNAAEPGAGTNTASKFERISSAESAWL